ncbi:hypothetical protein E2C01_057574 [Portunus trituberculatus]|uniref:Uncharacterized protein n=1 Tax=Portunus trituberculatus TaxID=210409 RepID=A0A5B7H1H2_PORTR|nr:hypothetical protein [Portunus trituberculatus]
MGGGRCVTLKGARGRVGITVTEGSLLSCKTPPGEEEAVPSVSEGEISPCLVGSGQRPCTVSGHADHLRAMRQWSERLFSCVCLGMREVVVAAAAVVAVVVVVVVVGNKQ